MKGHVLGRRRLADIAKIVTPDTILRWYRRSPEFSHTTGYDVNGQSVWNTVQGGSTV